MNGSDGGGGAWEEEGIWELCRKKVLEKRRERERERERVPFFFFHWILAHAMMLLSLLKVQFSSVQFSSLEFVDVGLHSFIKKSALT
jgi:hypothetical protein